MQTRVFRNERQIHRKEKKFTHLFFTRKRRGRSQKNPMQDWKTPKAAGEKNSVQRAAVALRRVQENLTLQGGGL